MNKQLLVDVRPFDVSRKKINESIKENDGRLVVKGVLQRAESKNQNGRVYPREVLLKEVGKYLENQVTERRALGELDHPESSVVNLNNASHNIVEMHWNGDDLMGTVEVLSTPAGNILKELFRSGIKLGISSRGLGSVEPIELSPQLFRGNYVPHNVAKSTKYGGMFPCLYIIRILRHNVTCDSAQQTALVH